VQNAKSEGRGGRKVEKCRAGINRVLICLSCFLLGEREEKKSELLLAEGEG